MKSRSKTTIELIVTIEGNELLSVLQRDLLASLSPKVRKALLAYLKELK